MNILHIVDEPYDSGIVHYAQTACRALKDSGHDVHFAGRADRFPVRRAEELGLKTLPLPAFPKSVLVLRQYLAAQNIELVNAHTGASQTLAVLATRALGRGLPVVRTRGDARPVRATAAGSVLWRNTAGFIAATRRILDEFRAVNGHLDIPMEAILPAIPGAAARPPGEPGDFPPDPPRIGILARLDPVKGHVHFLRAAARILRSTPNARFAVAGREENVKTAHLKSIASDLGVAENTEFLGHVQDIRAFMGRCRVGIVASVGSEAVSRAAIEWMAAGRPLVSTSVGSLPELVADGETGFLVPPEDPEAMADRILKLLESPERWGEFASAARRRFEAHFTERRLADDTQRFYENVLHLSPR